MAAFSLKTFRLFIIQFSKIIQFSEKFSLISREKVLKKNWLSYFAKIIEIAFSKLEFKGLIDGLGIEAFLKSWKMGGFQLNFFASRESW